MDIDELAAKYLPTHLAKTKVGDVEISTISLSDPYGTYGSYTFETMIFEGEHDQVGRRYCTRQEAEAGHREWVADIAAGRKPTDS